MNFKEMLTDKFVEGHEITDSFIIRTMKKLDEEIKEFEIAFIESGDAERHVSEMLDVFQAVYSNLLLFSRTQPERMEKCKKEWMIKQQDRIKKYVEPKIEAKVVLNGEEIKLTDEQIGLINSIIKGGKKCNL